MSADATARPRKLQGSWRSRLLAAGIGVLACVAAAILAFYLLGKHRLAAALEDARLSGDPLRVEDLRGEVAEPKLDAREWLAGFTFAVEYTRDAQRAERDQMDPPFGEMEDQKKQDERERSLEAQIEELPGCAGSFAKFGKDAFALFAAIDEAMDDPLHAREVPECYRAVFRWQRIDFASDEERALQACEVGRFDGVRAIRAARDMYDYFSRPEMLTLCKVSEVLEASAYSAASDGDGPEAVRRLAAELCQCRIAAGLPMLTGCQAWTLCMQRALASMRRMLLILPRGLDLAAIDRELASVDPRAELERALVQERIFGIFVYRDFDEHSGLAVSSPRDIPSWLMSLATRYDEAAYLRLMNESLTRLRAPDWSTADWSNLPSPGDQPLEYFSIVSYYIAPPVDRAVAMVATLQCELTLARAALIAYRDGTEAARAWLSTQPDPFDGEPLRSRVDADGVLTLWSVGPNRTDEGGSRKAVDAPAWARESDVFWRLPAW